MTPRDGVGWARFLQPLAAPARVTINAEHYSMDSATGSILDGNGPEVRAREAYYIAPGMVLGPALELRYWLANHPL